MRYLLTGLATLLVASSFSTALSQSWTDTSKINKWFEDQKGRKYEMGKPGSMQTPGNIQQAGDIQIPQGLQAIKTVKADCKEKLIVCADTLFEFDKATLTPGAEATLKLLGPKIVAYGPHPIFIDGHTDSKGDDEYNQQLSVRRAERVKNWLLMNHFVDKDALVQGWGEKKPVAPNTKPDGKDNPQGRQQNRRVEIVIDTCKKLEAAGTAPPVVPGANGAAPTAAESAPPTSVTPPDATTPPPAATGTTAAPAASDADSQPPSGKDAHGGESTR